MDTAEEAGASRSSQCAPTITITVPTSAPHEGDGAQPNSPRSPKSSMRPTGSKRIGKALTVNIEKSEEDAAGNEDAESSRPPSPLASPKDTTKSASMRKLKGAASMKPLGTSHGEEGTESSGRSRGPPRKTRSCDLAADQDEEPTSSTMLDVPSSPSPSPSHRLTKKASSSRLSPPEGKMSRSSSRQLSPPDHHSSSGSASEGTQSRGPGEAEHAPAADELHESASLHSIGNKDLGDTILEKLSAESACKKDQDDVDAAEAQAYSHEHSPQRSLIIDPQYVFTRLYRDARKHMLRHDVRLILKHWKMESSQSRMLKLGLKNPKKPPQNWDHEQMFNRITEKKKSVKKWREEELKKKANEEMEGFKGKPEISKSASKMPKRSIEDWMRQWEIQKKNIKEKAASRAESALEDCTFHPKIKHKKTPNRVPAWIVNAEESDSSMGGDIERSLSADDADRPNSQPSVSTSLYKPPPKGGQPAPWGGTWDTSSLQDFNKLKPRGLGGMTLNEAVEHEAAKKAGRKGPQQQQSFEGRFNEVSFNSNFVDVLSAVATPQQLKDLTRRAGGRGGSNRGDTSPDSVDLSPTGRRSLSARVSIQLSTGYGDVGPSRTLKDVGSWCFEWWEPARASREVELDHTHGAIKSEDQYPRLLDQPWTSGAITAKVMEHIREDLDEDCSITEMADRCRLTVENLMQELRNNEVLFRVNMNGKLLRVVEIVTIVPQHANYALVGWDDKSGSPYLHEERMAAGEAIGEVVRRGLSLFGNVVTEGATMGLDFKSTWSRGPNRDDVHVGTVFHRRIVEVFFKTELGRNFQGRTGRQFTRSGKKFAWIHLQDAASLVQQMGGGREDENNEGSLLVWPWDGASFLWALDLGAFQGPVPVAHEANQIAQKLHTCECSLLASDKTGGGALPAWVQEQVRVKIMEGDPRRCLVAKNPNGEGCALPTELKYGIQDDALEAAARILEKCKIPLSAARAAVPPPPFRNTELSYTMLKMEIWTYTVELFIDDARALAAFDILIARQLTEPKKPIKIEREERGSIGPRRQSTASGKGRARKSLGGLVKTGVDAKQLAQALTRKASPRKSLSTSSQSIKVSPRKSVSIKE